MVAAVPRLSPVVQQSGKKNPSWNPRAGAGPGWRCRGQSGGTERPLLRDALQENPQIKWRRDDVHAGRGGLSASTQPAVSPRSFFFFYFISVITADSGGSEPWRRFPRVRVVSDLKGQRQRQLVGHCSPERERIHQCQLQHRNKGNKLKNGFRRNSETQRTFDICLHLNVTLFPWSLL